VIREVDLRARYETDVASKLMGFGKEGSNVVCNAELVLRYLGNLPEHHAKTRSCPLTQIHPKYKTSLVSCHGAMLHIITIINRQNLDISLLPRQLQPLGHSPLPLLSPLLLPQHVSALCWFRIHLYPLRLPHLDLPSFLGKFWL